MYYRHSGRFSLGGVLHGLIIGCASALAVGYAYGRGLTYIPEAHIAVLSTIAFGGLVGAATGFGLKRGDVRNKRVTLVVTALSSLLALYMSWAVWIDFVFRRTGNHRFHWSAVAQRPAALLYLMVWLNHYGTWAFDNSMTATKGWVLSVVWIGEALIVIGCAVVAAVAVGLQKPFCEACSRWCRRAVRLVLNAAPDSEELKHRIENKDLSSLEGLGLAPKASDHLIVTLHSCNHCCEFHTLSLTQVLVHRKKFGQAPIRMSTIVQHLVVDPGQAQALHRLREKLTQTAKLAPALTQGAAAGGQR